MRPKLSQACICVGGQKSSQDRKEAHKAKRKAKKGGDTASGPSAITAAPTAEALAAVGASQLSKAAQERRQEIEKNKAAANGTDHSNAAKHAVPPAPHTGAAASGSDQSSVAKHAVPAALRDGAAAAQEPAGKAPHDCALPAAQAGDEEEEVSTASSSEEDEAQLDVVGGAEVSCVQLKQHKWPLGTQHKRPLEGVALDEQKIKLCTTPMCDLTHGSLRLCDSRTCRPVQYLLLHCVQYIIPHDEQMLFRTGEAGQGS